MTTRTMNVVSVAAARQSAAIRMERERSAMLRRDAPAPWFVAAEQGRI